MTRVKKNEKKPRVWHAVTDIKKTHNIAVELEAK